MTRAAAFVVIATSLAAMLSACHGSADGAASAPVAAERAIRPPARESSATRSFLGIVVSPATVEVSSNVDGRLLQVLVRAGDRVKQDDVLARIDVRSAQKDLAMARAVLLTSESERDRAKLELEQAAERMARRSTTVEISTGVVATASREEQSSSEYQRKLARVRLRATEAAMAEKQAYLDKLRLLVAEGVVRAPFAGRVTARYLDTGAALQKGTPIVRLIEDGSLRVRFAMPEDDAVLVPGDPVRLSVGRIELAGAVDKVVPEIDTAARMIFAESRIIASARELERVHPGQVAHVAPDATAAMARRAPGAATGLP